MKKIRELTERQQKFLDVLFEQANGDPTQAKILAGYSEHSSTSSIVATMKDEIMDATQLYMSRNAPKAAVAMVSGVDDPTQFTDIKNCKTHDVFGIDVVAQNSEELWITEVKGETNGGLPAATSTFMSGLGQILSRITRIDEKIHYGLAVPNTDNYATSVRKFVNSPILEKLNLSIILVQNDHMDFISSS